MADTNIIITCTMMQSPWVRFKNTENVRFRRYPAPIHDRQEQNRNMVTMGTVGLDEIEEGAPNSGHVIIPTVRALRECIYYFIPPQG